MGEAVLFFDPKLTRETKYIRKQNAQLFSKMRYVGAQFSAYLKNDLWKKSALHANRMARLLAAEVSGIPGITITQKVEANGVFAIIPKEIISPLQEKFFFYVWNDFTHEVRWMTSFDTTEQEIAEFGSTIRKLLS